MYRSFSSSSMSTSRLLPMAYVSHVSSKEIFRSEIDFPVLDPLFACKDGCPCWYPSSFYSCMINQVVILKLLQEGSSPDRVGRGVHVRRLQFGLEGT